MKSRKLPIQIIRTKLHRPPLVADFVCSPRLYNRLGEGGWIPLTLVTAPAGYGKSTLVSHWLQNCKSPSAWVSLDDSDSDARLFLDYLVEAIRSMFPSGESRPFRLKVSSTNQTLPSGLAAMMVRMSGLIDFVFLFPVPP